jgi:predicted phosphoadenosine phosphosulfate sulfurtransferase
MKIDPKVKEFLQQQPVVTLGFSTGKDSVACALLLRELKVKFIPVFFYHCPDLEFVERNLKMYEDFFETEIIRMPHPMLYDYLRHQDFMGPDAIDYFFDLDIPHLTFEQLIGCHLDSIGIPEDLWDVVGMRASESFNRRMVFRKQGFFNEKKKKVFPIAEWNKKDVLAYLTEQKCPLTPDYDIWGRSFDGLKYQFLFGVKQRYPEDYARLKQLFPLLDIELFRYEKNIQYFQS